MIGFQTTKQLINSHIDEVEKLFDKLKNAQSGTSNNLVNAASTLPSSLIKANTAKEIGFDDPSLKHRNGVLVLFSHKNHNDLLGTITIEVTLYKGNFTRKFNFRLKGYKTSNKLINMHINEAKKLFDNWKNAPSGTTTILGAASTTLPSKLKTDNVITAAAIGFINPLTKTEVDSKGVIATFKIIDYNDELGTLKVRATLSKNFGDNQVVEFTLKGYQTKKQIRAIKIQALKLVKELNVKNFDQVYGINDKNKLASHISNQNNKKISSIIKIIKNKITSVQAKALITSNIINFDFSIPGTLIIKISLNTFGESTTKNIKIDGFKKNQLENSDQKTWISSKWVIIGTIGGFIYIDNNHYLINYKNCKIKKIK